MTGFTKLALCATAAFGAQSASAASLTIGGGSQTSIDFDKFVAGTVIDSVVYRVNYSLLAEVANSSVTAKPYTYTGSVGTADFGATSFSGSGTVAASSNQNIRGGGEVFGTLTTGLDRFVGTGVFSSTLFGNITSLDGDVVNTGRGFRSATYNITFNYQEAPAIPEPSIWALMLAGFSLTGYALRRRRAKVAFA